MTKIQNPKAVKRLSKKLSALRQVLNKDERDVLDAIIPGEVAVHSLKGKAKAAPTGKPIEVITHSLKGKAKAAPAQKTAEAAAN